MAIIEVRETGSDEIRTIPLESNGATIGRADDNTIAISHTKISRYHARITMDHRQFFIEDLHSGNGTRLNNIPLKAGEKMILRPKDRIDIGPFHLLFEDESAGIPDFNDVTDSDILEIKLLKKVLHTLDKERLPSLEVTTGVVAGKKLVITEDMSEITIGRDAMCDFAIEEYVVSRQHARIIRKDSTFALFDLDSKNGTFLNGRRIKESRIQDGDHFSCGTIEIVFRNPAQINLDDISDVIKAKRKPVTPLIHHEGTPTRTETTEPSQPGDKLESSESTPVDEPSISDRDLMDMERELSEYSDKHLLADYPTPTPVQRQFSPIEMGMLAFGALVITFGILALVNLLTGATT